MPVNQLNLLKTSRFLPLFLTQFLGAFNDNVYKNSLVILITYTLSNAVSFNPEILITLAAGIFILPFFLFSALAGQLADTFEKSRLIRYTKLIEVTLAFIACIGFYLHNIYLLMLVLFLLGTQATFFGPMKYSILPDHLKTEELIAGNALLEAGTFLAILLGTILGGILAMLHSGIFLVSISIVVIALIGYFTSFFIPRATIAAPNLKINLNIFIESFRIVKYTFQKRELLFSIIGISWFWLVGATYLSQFPTYAKDVLGAQSSVVTLFLTCFTAGIGIGSLFCNRLLKGKIKAIYAPYAAIAMAILGIDLVIATHYGVAKPNTLMSLTEFLSFLPNWHILIDLLFISIAGGIYVVPLYTILQYESEPSHRSRAIATNNIMNACFMVIAAIGTSLMLYLHFTVTHVFLVVAIINFFMAVYIKRL
ncbi:MAG: MFS transporter [Proteobacteria bacterium]|nr:MFS transporter [Pseudomonadota bacterium]